MRGLIVLLIGVILVISACEQPETGHNGHSLDNTHPVSDTMGCSSEEVEAEGACYPKSTTNNFELFGELDESTIKTEFIESHNGFLAQPASEGIYPGIVMIHEWWGLNENIKGMAKHLAKEGFVVFAVDMYNGEVASDATKARELVTAVREDQESATKTLRKSVQYLRSLPNVEKVGSMGWCFGGGQSLQLAISGEELDATVIYYGHLTGDTESLARIDWPVLGIFGAEDTSIPVDSVEQFEVALYQLEIPNEIKVYEGVGHAFANPSGSRFAPSETKDAWEKTVSFLNKELKEE